MGKGKRLKSDKQRRSEILKKRMKKRSGMRMKMEFLEVRIEPRNENDKWREYALLFYTPKETFFKEPSLTDPHLFYESKGRKYPPITGHPYTGGQTQAQVMKRFIYGRAR